MTASGRPIAVTPWRDHISGDPARWRVEWRVRRWDDRIDTLQMLTYAPWLVERRYVHHGPSLCPHHDGRWAVQCGAQTVAAALDDAIMDTQCCQALSLDPCHQEAVTRRQRRRRLVQARDRLQGWLTTQADRVRQDAEHAWQRAQRRYRNPARLSAVREALRTEWRPRVVAHQGTTDRVRAKLADIDALLKGDT